MFFLILIGMSISQSVVRRSELTRSIRFYPERWEAPTKEMQDAWMPFGGGARGMLVEVVF